MDHIIGELPLRSIGGHFELELPPQKPQSYPDAVYFQLARATFFALFIDIKPNGVWMAKTIYYSMQAQLQAVQIETVFSGLVADQNALCGKLYLTRNGGNFTASVGNLWIAMFFQLPTIHALYLD